MPLISLKCAAALTFLIALSACGGGGGSNSGGPSETPPVQGAPDFNEKRVFSSRATGETLDRVEIDDSGTPTPADDVRVNLAGFALSSNGSIDVSIAATSTQAVAGPRVTVTLDGVDYVLEDGNAISTNGRLALLPSTGTVGDQSAAVLLATGASIGNGTAPVEVFGYIRGLATPEAGLPTQGVAIYEGNATFASTVSESTQAGTFDLTLDFDTARFDGSLKAGAVEGEIAGDATAGALQGALNLETGAQWSLIGNLYGADANELAAVASGTFETGSGVVILQGDRSN